MNDGGLQARRTGMGSEEVGAGAEAVRQSGEGKALALPHAWLARKHNQPNREKKGRRPRVKMGRGGQSLRHAHCVRMPPPFTQGRLWSSSRLFANKRLRGYRRIPLVLVGLSSDNVLGGRLFPRPARGLLEAKSTESRENGSKTPRTFRAIRSKMYGFFGRTVL